MPGTRRSFKAILYAGATAVMISASGSAAAGNCVKTSDLPALQTRMFQTELMIAALSCDRRKGYNRIIEKFGDELAMRGRSLKRVFKQLHGTEAEKRLNRFLTRIANEASMRSLGNPRYCNQAGALITDTLELQPEKLASFVEQKPFSRKHGLPVCELDSQVSEIN